MSDKWDMTKSRGKPSMLVRIAVSLTVGGASLSRMRKICLFLPCEDKFRSLGFHFISPGIGVKGQSEALLCDLLVLPSWFSSQSLVCGFESRHGSPFRFVALLHNWQCGRF